MYYIAKIKYNYYDYYDLFSPLVPGFVSKTTERDNIGDWESEEGNNCSQFAIQAFMPKRLCQMQGPGVPQCLLQTFSVPFLNTWAREEQKPSPGRHSTLFKLKNLIKIGGSQQSKVPAFQASLSDSDPPSTCFLCNISGSRLVQP